MYALLRALLACFQPRETASQKAKRLLATNLTPLQITQYDTFRFFDVIGGETGHRYRINRGDALNVDEYDEGGRRMFRWCFQPTGNLARGDVLLAQKLALELFESEARAVANRYPCEPLSLPRVRTSG